MAKLATALTATRLRRQPPGRADGLTAALTATKHYQVSPETPMCSGSPTEREPTDSLPVFLMLG